MSNTPRSKFATGADAAHGSGGSFPKFPVDVRLESKLDDQDMPFFRLYDGSQPEGQREIQIRSQIAGPVIGMAMRIEGYSNGTKTGYSSTPFFANNNRVAVFARGGVDSGKKVYEGSADDAVTWMKNKIGADGNVKKRRIFYVAVVNKGKVQVVEISSNLTMSIEEVNELMAVNDKDVLKNNTAIFTPTRYDKSQAGKLSKVARKTLDILISNRKSEMGYAKIERGSFIDDKMWDSYIQHGKSLGDLSADFTKWKEFVQAGAGAKDNGEVDTNNYAQTNNAPISNEDFFQSAHGGGHDDRGDINNWEGDLPF